MGFTKATISPGLRGAFFYGAYWGAVGLFEPFLIVYYLSKGLSSAEIGWMAAVMPLCTLLINPLVARLADRVHKRTVLLAAACAGFGAALTLPAVLPMVLPGIRFTFPLLLAIVAVFAAFRSPIIPVADSLIAAMAVRHNLEFGSMRLWGSVIFTVTAVGLGSVWQKTGLEAMFLVTGLSFLPVMLAALRLENAPPLHVDGNTNTKPRFVIEAGVVFLLAATFLIIAALFMVGTFGAVYITALGESPVLVGMMIGFGALGEVPGMLFGSRIARRTGDTTALLVSYLTIGIGLAGFALTTNPVGIVLFGVLRGLGFGLMLVSTVMIINSRAPRGLSATYQGILNAACWGLAPLLGGPISGMIYGSYGPLALFFVAAGMAAAAALIILPTYRLWRAQVPSVVFRQTSTPADPG